MLLNVDDTNEMVEKSVEIYGNFVDALERKNTFDMDRMFTELYYEHLKMISGCCENDEFSKDISDEAESLSLEHEMARSYVSKYYGMDFHKVERDWEDAVREERDEAMAFAKECLEDQRKYLEMFRDAMRKRNIATVISMALVACALAKRWLRR